MMKIKNQNRYVEIAPNGTIKPYSYRQLIGFIYRDMAYFTTGKWSVTTSRHQHEFLKEMKYRQVYFVSQPELDHLCNNIHSQLQPSVSV